MLSLSLSLCFLTEKRRGRLPSQQCVLARFGHSWDANYRWFPGYVVNAHTSLHGRHEYAVRYLDGDLQPSMAEGRVMPCSAHCATAVAATATGSLAPEEVEAWLQQDARLEFAHLQVGRYVHEEDEPEVDDVKPEVSEVPEIVDAKGQPVADDWAAPMLELQDTKESDEASSSGLIGRSLLNAMSRRGKYTAVLEVVSAHCDRIAGGQRDDLLLENKLTTSSGGPAGALLDDLLSDGDVRPLLDGFLGYLRCKSASVCYSELDVEVHNLTNEWHFASSGVVPLTASSSSDVVPDPRPRVEEPTRKQQQRKRKHARARERTSEAHSLSSLPAPRGAWDGQRRFRQYGHALTDWPLCPYT